MPLFTIASIDDHELFRHGIELIIKKNFGAVKFLSFASVEEALSSNILNIPLILLDDNLPGLRGISSIPFLKRRWPKSSILVITADSDQETASAALALGADAAVCKSDTLDQLIAAIGCFIPRNDTKADLSLSQRQVEVLQLLSEGFTNKAIARRLALSEFTVRGHVQAVFRTLGANNRSEAVFSARQLGLL